MHQPRLPPQHVEDRASHDRQAPTVTATATAARYDTSEWSGRDGCSNMENEMPDAFSQHRNDVPRVKQRQQQQQEQSSWRKLKKLDHQHLHPRQISPSRVSTAPVAVVVESGPPTISEGGGGGGRSYKRTINGSTEDDLDNDSLNTSANSSRGSFYAYSGSPGSEASSRRRSAAAASSPMSRGSLGFYLGAPAVDSSPPSSAVGTVTDITAAIPATANCGGYPSAADHNIHHRQARHGWDREQTPRAVGGADAGRCGDEGAAAAAVLGLRNGHTSAAAAAAAAVAATQPPTAAAVVGSKRGREVIEQVQAPLPTAVNHVLAVGGPAAGSATKTTHVGSGDVTGGHSLAGAVQWTGKR